jgi:hypothetical protein
MAEDGRGWQEMAGDGKESPVPVTPGRYSYGAYIQLRIALLYPTCLPNLERLPGQSCLCLDIMCT